MNLMPLFARFFRSVMPITFPLSSKWFHVVRDNPQSSCLGFGSRSQSEEFPGLFATGAVRGCAVTSPPRSAFGTLFVAIVFRY